MSPALGLVYSDHGFSSCDAILNLTRLLSETTSLRVTASPDKSYRMAAAYTTAASVYLEHKAIYVDRRHSLENTIDNIAEVLRSSVDPSTGDPILHRVISASELYGPLRETPWEVLLLEPAARSTVRNGSHSQPLLHRCVPNRDHWLIGIALVPVPSGLSPSQIGAVPIERIAV